ncbi:MAG TPA: ATPase P [Caldithrix abyssi]|uniref:ATPase P n=1 Tax=Caldithrix abyssi TaxID=187145 RepID=A0A7V4WTZ1_CALAY|nr:ATPase P [Caldithrix abyssi]
MIRIDVPVFGLLSLEYLVMDYNGTLAIDGRLIAGVTEAIEKLSNDMEIHIVTADTFGKVRKEMKGLPVVTKILPPANQAEAKRAYVRTLGEHRCVCIGNGRNDRLMLKEAALGIAAIQNEGAARATVESADIVVNHIVDALNLLIHPLRLIATLRD